jgi:phosphopentomutase
MTRAVLLVLDSVGVGGAPDADLFGDLGANTLGHVAGTCAAGEGDRANLRRGPLRVPNLVARGLGAALEGASGAKPAGLRGAVTGGRHGWAAEVSKGKDTPSGHWELAGVPVTFEWGYFPRSQPCFPKALTEALIAEAKLPGILGDKHASGTEIIAELGEEHVRTDKPILYTSADSVLQIAAHEEAFGLERLYALCAIARRLVDPLTIGRVIARPFVGASAADFARTANRRDYSVPPPAPTLLEGAANEGRAVIAVGKIADIFAHRGPTEVVKASGNAGVGEATRAGLRGLPDGGLLVANFVDFDQLYGHRRDVPGYAAALEAFDRWLPAFETALAPGDLAIVTADHGCDPTWMGTDHTREQVPVLCLGPGLATGSIGARTSFADVGATLGRHLGLKWTGAGRAF